jgi:hypothetical protein
MRTPGTTRAPSQTALREVAKPACVVSKQMGVQDGSRIRDAHAQVGERR